MIQQGILPFKIERTDELITPRSGLAMFAEVIRALKIEGKVAQHFPPPGSNRGFEAWAYVEPLLLMIEGGGRHIEDLREIRDDETLRRLIGLRRMPSLSTYGDWLVRLGRQGGVEAMRTVNEETAGTITSRLAIQEYTLDVDATVIESWKEEAKPTYKEVPGYQPILGFLAETGVCLSHEFREGNVAAHSRALAFVKRCVRLCPKIKYLRSDSAFYQADVINWCQANGLGYTITADQDVAVKAVLRTVRDWQPLLDEEGKPTGREVGTAIHTMGKTQEPFRLVVQRWQDAQRSLFKPLGYSYYVIATNRDELTPTEVVRFHNQRGQVENFIKELKIGFGMEQMTSGDFRANALWFSIGVLVSILSQAQKLLFLDPEWTSKTIATLRWQLIETAGRLVRHGRRMILYLATSWGKYQTFLQIRRRAAAFI
jgi:hypothetical protein